MNTGAGVFSNCAYLRSVKYASYTGDRPVAFPDTLLTIGKQCFRDSFPADMSFAVDIPESVANIGAEAFNTNNNGSSRVSTIYVKRASDYSGYDRYAFQNGKSFIVFPNAASYSEAIKRVNNSQSYTPTYELDVIFRKTEGDTAETVDTQRKLYNQYIYYEKREDDVWTINEGYTLPELDGVALKPGYEISWYFEKNQETVSDDSRINDDSSLPETINILTNGIKICTPEVTVSGPGNVCKGSDITLKAEVTNKMEGIHYEYIWAKWDSASGEWIELEGENQDTLQVSEGNLYYLAVVTAYDDDGNKSEQGNDYIFVNQRQHQWIYESEENKITVKCTNSGCKYDSDGVTSVLQADDMEYTGKPYDKASFGAEITKLTGVTASAIQYFSENSSDALPGAPTEIGKYKAYVELSNGEKAWKSFNITKAQITPEVTIKDWTYGEPADTPVVTGNIEQGAEKFTYYTDKDCTIPTNNVNGAEGTGAAPKNAGTYYVKAEISETENYTWASAVTTFKISPKIVTVTPDNIKKFTGKADPELTYKVNGLVENDILSGITITRKSGEKVGRYNITASAPKEANPNYSITFKKAVFTIEQGDQSNLNAKSIAKLKLPLLLAKGQGGNKSIKLSWLKYSGATGYETYWCYCDGSANYRKFATVKNGKLSFIHKNLKSNREYKYFVAAYKMVEGRKIYIAKSNTLHIAIKQANTTNAASIKVNKDKVTLSAGKTFKIRCTTKVENSKKKQLFHTSSYRYYTSNNKVAVVSKDGIIKANGRGTCTIYVLANNGVYHKIKVTVK